MFTHNMLTHTCTHVRTHILTHTHTHTHTHTRTHAHTHTHTYTQEADLIVRFLPELVSVMTEPSLRGMHVKLKQEYTPLEPSSSFISQMASSQEAMLLSCTYSLQLLEKKDFRTLCLLLPAIAKAYVSAENDTMPDGYLHSLVVMLIPHLASLREAQLVSIMKGFWVVCSQYSETGLLYCCRLLWACHDKLKPAYFVSDILQSISPSQEVRYPNQLLVVVVLILCANSCCQQWEVMCSNDIGQSILCNRQSQRRYNTRGAIWCK